MSALPDWLCSLSFLLLQALHVVYSELCKSFKWTSGRICIWVCANSTTTLDLKWGQNVRTRGNMEWQVLLLCQYMYQLFVYFHFAVSLYAYFHIFYFSRNTLTYFSKHLHKGGYNTILHYCSYFIFRYYALFSLYLISAFIFLDSCCYLCIFLTIPF